RGDLVDAPVAEGGQEMAGEEALVVLERALRALARQHHGLEAGDPRSRQLGEGDLRAWSELASVRLDLQQIALSACFGELRPHRAPMVLAGGDDVHAVVAVCLPVQAALDACSLHRPSLAVAIQGDTSP